MDKAILKEIKQKLLNEKTMILNGGILTRRDDLHVQPEDLPDEADVANSVITQQVTFNIRQRELSKLRLIEDALYRMENGTYGICEDCEEPIEAKRLQKQPYAALCITHAEEAERQQGRLRLA